MFVLTTEFEIRCLLRVGLLLLRVYPRIVRTVLAPDISKGLKGQFLIRITGKDGCCSVYMLGLLLRVNLICYCVSVSISPYVKDLPGLGVGTPTVTGAAARTVSIPGFLLFLPLVLPLTLLPPAFPHTYTHTHAHIASRTQASV